jgi:thiol:disulfide interchange protein
MNQKEPVKITLSGIFRWIFGLFFLVIALWMVTEREYFSAVFIFMAAFGSFPPISNLLESDLNISISGPVRFLVVILLLVGSVAVESSHSSSAVIYTHAFSGSNITNQDNNGSYWEWEWFTPSHIGDTKAPKGYK